MINKSSLKQMIEIGKECGLETLEEQYNFYLNHYVTFFNVNCVKEQLLQLQKEMFYEYPDEFVKIFDCKKDDLIKKGWKIKNG